jgi:hypothetical protein
MWLGPVNDTILVKGAEGSTGMPLLEITVPTFREERISGIVG